MNNPTDKGRIWLYDNNYAKTDRHPVKTGPGEISRSVLKTLVAKIKESKEDVVKIQCAAWERVSKKGNHYTFVTIEPHEDRGHSPQLHEDGGQNPQAGSDDIPF